MSLEEEHAALISEKATLEREVAERRLRISVIRTILQGENGQQGLTAKVEVLKAKQAWVDGEPARAALRDTPEWQAWRSELMKRIKS